MEVKVEVVSCFTVKKIKLKKCLNFIFAKKKFKGYNSASR